MARPALPPDLTKGALDLIPSRLREDALQEAWVAILSGKDGEKALKAFVARERWRSKKTTSIETIACHDD